MCAIRPNITNAQNASTTTAKSMELHEVEKLTSQFEKNEDTIERRTINDLWMPKLNTQSRSKKTFTNEKYIFLQQKRSSENLVDFCMEWM